MMFGSFDEAFGLPFPFQAADTQGGLFGQNAPTQPQIGSMTMGAAEQPAAPATAPAAQPPGPLASPLAPQSPLAPPQTGTRPTTPPTPAAGPVAPAAGVDSQFGRPEA
jgi:hypothetical protein